MRIDFSLLGVAKTLGLGVGVAAVTMAGVALSKVGQRPATPRAPLADTSPNSAQLAAGAVGGPAAEAGFIGVLMMGETVQVEPKVDGRIEQVLVKPGDQVMRGDIIARLDMRSLQHELRMQSATSAGAAKRLRRRIPLSRGRLSAVTPEELDGARYDAVREREKLTQLQQAVAEGNVAAPFDGTVTERFLAAGAIAGPGRPVIRLLGRDKPRVRFAIPEGQSHDVIAGMPIAMAVDSMKERAPGTIVSVNPEIDSASRMAYAMANISIPQGLEKGLNSGVMARVFISPPTTNAPSPPSYAAPHPTINGPSQPATCEGPRPNNAPTIVGELAGGK